MGLPNIYYVKAGLEKEKAVLLVVLAALSDGSKVVVSVTSGHANLSGIDGKLVAERSFRHAT